MRKKKTKREREGENYKTETTTTTEWKFCYRVCRFMFVYILYFSLFFFSRFSVETDLDDAQYHQHEVWLVGRANATFDRFLWVFQNPPFFLLFCSHYCRKTFNFLSLNKNKTTFTLTHIYFCYSHSRSSLSLSLSFLII